MIEENQETDKQAFQKKSQVWDYFSIKGEQYECNLCRVTYKKSKATSQLLRHIQFKHQNSSNSKTQQLYQTSLLNDEYKLTKLSEQKIQHINNNIARFIITDMRPYSIIEGKGFRSLIQILEPRYQLISRKYLRDSLIPGIYNRSKQFLIDELSSIETLNITFDYWSNISMKSYLTITIHWIDKNFKYHSSVLQTQEAPDQHTGEYTSKLIKEVLKQFEINHDQIKIKTATSDKARNNVKCMQNYMSNWMHMTCFAHTLHNSILQYKKIPFIQGLIEKVRDIVKVFRYSSQNQNKLQQLQIEQKLPISKLKLDIVTRWSSLHDMLTRFLQNKIPITLFLIKQHEQNKYREYTFDDQDWIIIKEIQIFLTDFTEITTFIQQQNNIIISSLIPLIENIQYNLLSPNASDSNHISLYKKQILEDFTERIIQYSQVKDLLLAATFLDPRFVQFYFNGKQGLFTQTKQYIINYYNQYKENNNNQKIMDLDDEAIPQQPFKKLFGENKVVIVQRELSIEQEILMYQNEFLNTNQCCLNWWSLNKEKYNHLSIIAQQILPIQATSVPCERLFSKAGYVYNKYRQSLSSTHFNEQLFLNNIFSQYPSM